MRSSSIVFKLVVFAIIGWSQIAAAERKKLVVVVAKGSSVTNISKRDLMHCFLGETVTNGDKTLKPFNAEARTQTRTDFDRAVLGMSPDDVGRYWVERKIRGQAPAPRALPTNGAIQKVVAKFPAAISYLPVDQLTADLQPIKVDNVAYSDTSYSLYTE